MVGMLPPHHSSGDWDFETTSWELNSTYYVSSPSSMHFLSTTNNTKVKTTVVPIANVKEGRVITQVRCTILNARTFIVFRWQDADNFYAWEVCSGNTYANQIWRRKAAVNTSIKSTKTAYLPAATWTNLRLTWWNDYVGLVVRTEYWNGSAWANVIGDAYDSENNWKAIGGRIGLGYFGITPSHGTYWYYDDTLIYGIPP